MSHSWERNTSFVPWVTRGIELRAFIERKVARSMHNMWSYIGKELHLLPQKDVPVSYQMIGYEHHLHSLVRGSLLLLHI